MPNAFTRFKRLLFGRPLASDRLEHERLTKKTALAVLSSDAISSVAYATEQILLVLAVLGTAALSYVVPVSAVVVALLVLVALSYRQTIFAYPGGGGSYTVARENLGQRAGLVAAAALLTDYILTVAVSVSGGIAAITSAYPALVPRTVTLCIGAVIVLMLVNLRGVRESGMAFSVPTYLFIGLMLLVLAVGTYRAWTGHDLAPGAGPVRVDALSAAQHGASWPAGFALTFLVLRAFAEGCVAMTGTEAISNGVSAFRRPSARNAATTLGWMALILATFFLGTSWLARHYAIMPSARETVLSQLGRHILGGGAVYFGFQYATFAVLVLAANTAFADFPRLASILAGDRYLPRQFAARGDRLAFSNGIIVLALLAMLLIWTFRGDTSALIPLYAVGVFVCFTLSQTGMVRHWMTRRSPGWRRKAALNGVGAVTTGLVAIVQVATKLTHGAWIVVLIIPLLIWLLVAIHRHYERFAAEVAFTGHAPVMFLQHAVVVPIGGITKATAGALVYATTIAADVRAVYVEVDPAGTDRLRGEWDAWDIGVELVVLHSPYRSVLRPLVDYVDGLVERQEADLVSVVVPEVVPHRWWEHLLHNKTALAIRTAFLFRPSVVVTSVPYRLGASARLRDRLAHDESLDEDAAPHPGTSASHAKLGALAVCVLASVLTACVAEQPSTRQTEISQQLAGSWQVRYVLDRAPVLGGRSVPAPEIRGELALFANAGLSRTYPLMARATDYGSYDVDFGAFGLSPPDRGRIPTVVAGALGADSVLILLDPGDDGAAVAMRGRLTRDGITGAWMVWSPGTGGSGRFVMRRRGD